MGTASRAPRRRWALVDSSAFLSLVNPNDVHHREAARVLERLGEERWRTFTTNFVVAETHALFLIRLGHSHATDFLREIARSSTVTLRPDPQDEERARAIVFQYEDKDFSLTDALSFAVMERLGIAHAFTFDRHFEQYGVAVLH